MTDRTAFDVPSGRPATVATPTPGDAALARLSHNQRTTANWNLRETIDGCLNAGIPSIGLWREPVAEVGLDTAVRWIADANLRVSSLCRGGFFTAEGTDFDAALAENRLAIDEAAALGAATLVLVPGGLPRGSRDIDTARESVGRALEALAPYADDRGVTLGIEPMHPIFAADRGVVSTLAQALELASPYPAQAVGVVVDTFHLWWEPGVLDLVRTVGDRIVSYQISDWITPLPPDALLSRGMMGDGHIDFAAWTNAVSSAGYNGDVEVEIFNADVFAAPGREVLATIARRHAQLVAPYLT